MSLLCEAASIGANGLSLIDSLECDADIDAPGMREAVNALIIAEMESMASEAGVDGSEYLSRAPPVPPVRTAPLVSTGVSSIDSSRYDAPAAPPLDAGADAWEGAARRAALAVEALEMRTVHVELASRYGVELWKVAVRDAVASAANAARDLAAVQARVGEIERARADALRSAAPKLAALGKRLGDAEISGTVLSVAISGARGELERAKKQKR